MANSKKNISPKLVEELTEAISRVDYGSVEVIVQNKTVTQITVRSIKKTNVIVSSEIKEEKVEHEKQIRRSIYIPNKN